MEFKKKDEQHNNLRTGECEQKYFISLREKKAIHH